MSYNIEIRKLEERPEAGRVGANKQPGRLRMPKKIIRDQPTVIVGYEKAVEYIGTHHLIEPGDAFVVIASAKESRTAAAVWVLKADAPVQPRVEVVSGI